MDDIASQINTSVLATLAAKAADKTPMAKFWGRWVGIDHPDRDEDDDNYDEYSPEELYVDGHVSCCGATFLSGFGVFPSDSALEQIDDLLKTQKHLYECILVDYQLIRWREPLEARGFKVVARWYNGNSGNYCNLLVRFIEEEE